MSSQAGHGPMVYWPKTAGPQMTFANSIRASVEGIYEEPTDIIIISHSEFYDQQLIMVFCCYLNMYQFCQYDLHMASKEF